jgi:hypothetical protein
VYPVAAAVNVEVAAVVPVAAVNVTFTPVCQLPLLSVTDAGVNAIAVLPARVRATVTLAVGAALSRMLVVPVPPLASVRDVGVAVIDGCVVPVMVKGTAADAALNAGFPLSNAVACAVWLPAAKPVTLKLYGDVVSEFTRLPSTRNSTRTMEPFASLAVAARGTVAPAVNEAPLAGLVRLTVGGVLVVPPPLHVVPLSVNEVGTPFVPLNVPLKPAVNVAPLPIL